LIAVYGVFMTPLGWKWAGFVWGYALVWFLINDRIKLLAYRIFDPVKVNPVDQSKAKSKPEVKDGPKPDAETKPKTEAKGEPTPEAKTPSEVTPELVKRVHELYEELGREDVKAVQKWERAKETTSQAAPDQVKK
jgi:H+-transporting ATPase